MSQLSAEPKPARRRAGLLSALSRLYNDAHDLMNRNASKEEIDNLIIKLDEQYMKYLDMHEVTLEEQPERELFLVDSHVLNEQRHRKIVSQIAVYLEDGSKPDDLESLHAVSLYSRHSSAKRSVTPSCLAMHRHKAKTASFASQARSATVSETRVQAHLAKRRFAQQEAEQLAQQKKIDFQREVARQNRELDRRREEAAARERQLREEAERTKRKLQQEAEAREHHLKEEAARKERELKLAAEEREHQVKLEVKRRQEELDMQQRQAQLDIEKQQRELDQRRRELEEEAELLKQEMENAMLLERQRNEMENLQTELHLHEREEIREELGSDYDSDGDCDDVTRYKESAPKHGFQLEREQNKLIQKVLQQITDHPIRSVPALSTARDPVNSLCDPVKDMPVRTADNIPLSEQRKRNSLPKNLSTSISKHPKDSFDEYNCGYVPPATSFRRDVYSGDISDKIHTDRPPIAEIWNQNVCKRRRDYLHPPKVTDTIATRTFPDKYHLKRPTL